MGTSVNSLPLLHKYVFSPHDDIELRMTKLKFRLCVKEVSDLQQLRGRGIDLTHKSEFEDDSPSPLNGKTDDSGLENDFCAADNSRCEANVEDIPVESDASRQGDSVIDDTYYSDNEDEEEQEEKQEQEQEEQEQERQKKCFTMNEEGDCFDNQNAPIEVNEKHSANDLDSVVSVPCLTSDENPTEDGEHVEKRKTQAQEPLPAVDFSTEMLATKALHPEKSLKNGTRSSVMENQLNISSRSPTNVDKSTECNDVLEALRILKTRSELPKVTTRKAATGAFSSWNAADLKRGSQKAPEEYSEYSEPTTKCKSELQVTNERILNKDRRINEMYTKIKERDEEDQRMMEELMRKQKIPDAEPLQQTPVATTTTTTTTTPTPTASSGNLSKSFQVERDVENQTPTSKDGTLQRKSAPETEEGPAKKKKKKKREGSFLQNMANSVQRRFSRRGRETVT